MTQGDQYIVPISMYSSGLIMLVDESRSITRVYLYLECLIKFVRVVEETA